MIDIKRKTPRFDVKFTLLSEDIQGKGVNISRGGFGFLTEIQIDSNIEIPFDAEVQGFVFSEKIYKIKGRARLLYSKMTDNNRGLFYNGFKFIELDDASIENLYELLNDIRIFQKNPHRNLEKKTLSDFIYYPSDDLFYKADLFNEALSNVDEKNIQMLSYYLDSPSKSTSTFVHKRKKLSRQMIMMGSNNYLGLTTHPDVINAAIEGVKKYGTGNGSGAMVSGTLSIHRQLEEELADFLGKEAVILFNSGYSTNLGTISGIIRNKDALVIDQFSHASIYDGCNLSRAKVLIFSHNNVSSLERILKRVKLNYNGLMIITDGIFSTDGSIAPIAEIVKIANKYNCKVMIDEAHGFGVLGEKGIGATEFTGQVDNVDIIMGTMSKSLAGAGGFIGSRYEVIEYIRFYARSYFFSTNIPPSVAASILKALQIIRDQPEIRENLKENIQYFKSKLQNMNLQIGDPQAAIVPLFIPDNNILLNISKFLFNRGIFHNVMTYPAVPMGGSLLRFGLMATHTREELNEVVLAIEEAAEKEGLFRYYKKLEN